MDIAYQKKAIDWLNSKRNFAEGIDILLKSGFRPGVVRTLARVGVEGPEAPERLRYNMQMFVRAFGDSTKTEDTDAELHVFEGEESKKDSTVHASGIMGDAEILPANNIGIITRLYAQSYKNREKAFNDLKKVGEKNDDVSVAARKKFNDIIDAETDFMEKAYPYYTSYKATGTMPTDDQVRELVNKDENKNEETPSKDGDVAGLEEADDEAGDGVDYDSMSKEELTKLQYSLTRKITRAKYMLLYQSENKQEVENPLPAGAKRIKFERKIEKLEPVLEAVKIAIAKK